MQKYTVNYAVLVKYESAHGALSYIEQLTPDEQSKLSKELLHIPGFWDVSQPAREAIAKLGTNVGQNGMSFIYQVEVEGDEQLHHEINGVLQELSRREVVMTSGYSLRINQMMAGEKDVVFDEIEHFLRDQNEASASALKP